MKPSNPEHTKPYATIKRAEWGKMSLKTRGALTEMIKRAVKMFMKKYNESNPFKVNPEPNPIRLAWLVENGKTQGHGLKYLTFDPSAGMFTWIEDEHKALHLSRRQDAELLAQECEDAWRIVEHGFVPT